MQERKQDQRAWDGQGGTVSTLEEKSKRMARPGAGEKGCFCHKGSKSKMKGLSRFGEIGENSSSVAS